METHLEETVEKLNTKVSQLETELYVARASQCFRYHFAEKEIRKTSSDYFKGSSIILEIKSNTGEQVVEPICIRDGLEHKTISALIDELRKSYKISTEFKPTEI